MNYLEKYTALYNNQPLWWRIQHQVRWKLDAIWSAICGRPGPGERILLKLIKEKELVLSDKEPK